MSVESTKAVLESYFRGQSLDDVAEDAVFTTMADGQEYAGREAIGEMMRTFYGETFNGRFESTGLLVGDGQACLEGYLAGEHTAEYAGVPASGKEVRVPMSIIYDVADEKIQRARIYFMTDSFRQQVS